MTNEPKPGVIQVNSPVKEARLMATVIRADGSVEELGTIAYWHKSRIVRLMHKLKIKR